MTLRAGVFLLLCLTGVFSAQAQDQLYDVRILSDRMGMAVVPALDEVRVAFRDYRNNEFGIFVVDPETGHATRIAAPFFAEPAVTTDAGRTAWIGYLASGQADVYVHNHAAGQTSRITTDTFFQNHPRLSGDLLVWQDYRHAGQSGTNAEIYLYDFRDGVRRRLTDSPAYQDLPAIDGHLIVWQDFRHAGTAMETAEIYVHDVSSGEAHRLTTGAAYRTHPAIHGTRVVWEDYRNGENGDIYLFDLATNQERPLSTHPAHQSHPAIYGDWVVWTDYRHDPYAGDLYGFHLPTETEHALLREPGHQDPPAIHGDRLVWQDYRGGGMDLYTGRLAAGTGSHAGDPTTGGAAAVTVIPNPSIGTVWIEVPDAGTARTVLLHDATGRIVWQAVVPAGSNWITWNGASASGSSLAPGLYLGRVISARGTESFTLVRL
jgi:beta propeller repeat protein